MKRETLSGVARRYPLIFVFTLWLLVFISDPVFAMNAKAAGVPGFTLGSVSATAGSSVTVPLFYSANGAATQPATLVVKIGWNAGWLALTGVQPGSALSGSGKSVDFAATATGVTVVVFGGISALPEGGILDFVFAVSSSAPTGTTATITDQGTNAADGAANAVPLSFGPGQVAVDNGNKPHSADSNGDWHISLSELLRVIQFYNIGSLHCQTGTEDGYAPGPGDTSCVRHSSDYAPVDWSISLSELLRLIQFYNASNGAYQPMAGSEDGYAPVFAK